MQWVPASMYSFNVVTLVTATIQQRRAEILVNQGRGALVFLGDERSESIEEMPTLGVGHATSGPMLASFSRLSIFQLSLSLSLSIYIYIHIHILHTYISYLHVHIQVCKYVQISIRNSLLDTCSPVFLLFLFKRDQCIDTFQIHIITYIEWCVYCFRGPTV